MRCKKLKVLPVLTSAVRMAGVTDFQVNQSADAPNDPDQGSDPSELG